MMALISRRRPSANGSSIGAHRTAGLALALGRGRRRIRGDAKTSSVREYSKTTGPLILMMRVTSADCMPGHISLPRIVADSSLLRALTTAVAATEVLAGILSHEAITLRASRKHVPKPN